MLKEIIDYIKEANFLRANSRIVCKTKNGNQIPLANIVGWNWIEDKFTMPDGRMDYNEAVQFEFELGNFIKDAINEKIERELINLKNNKK